MAIFRCASCGLVQEQPDSLVGTQWTCQRCNRAGPIYNTVAFVERLVAMYLDAKRESAPPAASPALPAQDAVVGTVAPAFPGELDIFNTEHFASEGQHGPIVDWFRRRQIQVDLSLRSVDTTGFFDEVASTIGQDYVVLKDVLDRIRWAQHKEYSSTTIPLGKKPPDEARAISAFCQQLYDFTFVEKCFHNRPENNIRLVIQTAPAIRRFFAGEWVEWFALVTCLSFAKEGRRRISCARNLAITLAHDQRHEIDVFVLFDGNQPLCIECKSGEFRQDIDRCVTLRKRLGLTGGRFVVCVAGLDEAKAAGLSATHDLTFLNERGLSRWLRQVMPAKTE